MCSLQASDSQFLSCLTLPPSAGKSPLQSYRGHRHVNRLIRGRRRHLYLRLVGSLINFCVSRALLLSSLLQTPPLGYMVFGVFTFFILFFVVVQCSCSDSYV